MNKPTTTTFVGWGRSNGSVSRHHVLHSDSELSALYTGEDSVIARGLGRAYGDAAQSGGGVVIDCTQFSEIIDLDLSLGRIRVQGGCSFEEMLRYVVVRGWFVPVTPGTSFVTVGGAIAADVHGKNHHRDGSIANYIEELVLVSPDGTHLLSRTSDPDLFWATCGGMGMTGVIVEATLQLVPIESAYVTVDTDRTNDLDSCMELLSSGDERYRYSVAWVDGRMKGRHLGRSVITSGDHAKVADLTVQQRHAPLAYDPKQLLRVPLTPPISMVNNLTLLGFNELWYRRSPEHREGETQTINTFFYPLDMLGGWNRLYGPRGFTQYQFVIPFGEEEVVRYALERLQQAGCPSSLVVLKRFGAADAAPMSFPIAGWTLALDIPLGSSSLAVALDDLDRHVANAGGRVYLAKDGRVRPELVRTMYPRLGEFVAQCQRVDPKGKIASDLSRRIGLRD